MTATRTVPVSAVQFATVSGLAEAGWSHRWTVKPLRAAIGVAAVGGDADLEEQIGRQVLPGARTVVTEPQALTSGMLVRILAAKDGGSVSLRTPADVPITLDPLWWGVVRGQQRRLITGAASTIAWRCDSLWGLLDDLPIASFPVLTDGGAVVALGAPPVINPTDRGNCSDEAENLAGSLVRVLHPRPASLSAVAWTAAELVRTLLAVASHPEWLLPPGSPAVVGLDWRLGDGEDLLGWEVPRFDLAGQTVRSALNAIIDHRRGLAASYRVVGSTVYVDILSVSPQSITSGGYTLPAGDLYALDVPAGEELHFLAGPDAAEDEAAADAVVLEGERPLVGITLHYAPGETVCALIPDGWAPTDEPTDAIWDVTWRRWKLNPDWAKDQFGHPAGVGLRRPTDLDGSRSYSATAMPAVHGLEIDRIIPWADDFTGRPDEPGRPRAFIRAGSATTDWIVYDVAITPRRDVPGIELALDAAGARRLRDQIGSTGVLAFTVGIREWSPMRVGWVRDSDDRPAIGLRMRRIAVPDCRQYIGLAGSIRGIDPATGTTLKTASDLVVIDHTDRMRERLAFHRARHTVRGLAVRWTQRGAIHTAWRPGYIVHNLSSDPTVLIDSFVSRIDWSFAGMPGVSFSTERPELDGNDILWDMDPMP